MATVDDDVIGRVGVVTTRGGTLAGGGALVGAVAWPGIGAAPVAGRVDPSVTGCPGVALDIPPSPGSAKFVVVSALVAVTGALAVCSPGPLIVDVTPLA